MEAKEMITLSLDQAQEYLDMALDGLTQEEAAWSPGPSTVMRRVSFGIRRSSGIRSRFRLKRSPPAGSVPRSSFLNTTWPARSPSR